MSTPAPSPPHPTDVRDRPPVRPERVLGRVRRLAATPGVRRWGVTAGAGLLVVLALVAGALLPGSPAGDLLMVLAAVVAGYPVARSAFRALADRTLGIDLLVTIAAGGALVIGEYWEAAAVTFLFALGHALEQATLGRTRAALAALVAVAPSRAVVLRDGVQVEVAATAVGLGETVLVKPGSKVPVDGEVTSGGGALDEASITGESLPVEKVPGDRVHAGTVSTGGLLHVRATGVGADTTLARIIHRVEEAQDDKARAQQLMERFAAWYTPGVVVGSVLAGLLTRDVGLALTLLVIACPGALVISMPVAMVAGIGRAARDGMLVKGGEHLEAAARVTAVALDKTGTLTHGRPQVTDVVVLDPDLDRRAVLSWAARAEAGSEHPLAAPVLAAARGAGLPAEITETPAARSDAVAGRGVVVQDGGHRVVVGTLSLLDAEGVPAGAATGVVTRLAAQGRTPLVVAVDGRVVGVVGVADEVRAEAAEMVRRLRAGGVRTVVMLTGDLEPVARAVARSTGVDDVRAGLLPEEKLEAVAALQRDGHVVAMVGDGVNDAPALATADVGVAMGAAGSAVAVETADLALMTDDLLRLPEALGLARRTVAVVRQNLAVALVTVSALLAGVLLGGVTMSLGMLVHEASVLVVIANAMRLLRRSRGLAAARSGA